MKAALLIVLSLSALAMAGPAFNKNTNNQIVGDKYNQQQQQHQFQQQQQQQQQNKDQIYNMQSGDYKKTQATEILEKWCFASQMSQTELTSSFKKLVQIVKSQAGDESTEQAVMSGRICQGALVQKSEKSGETIGQTDADSQAHELIKDVYMDALIACESRECMQQLLRIIESQQVDPIRASYYMTRVAIGSDISQKSTGLNGKDAEEQIKQLAMNFIKNANKQQMSEIVERQQLLAVTSTIDKVLKSKQIVTEEQAQKKQGEEMIELAKEVAKTIVERYIKPVSQQEIRQYQEQPEQIEQQNEQLIKKIAKRSAGLKALANLPAWCIKQQAQLEQTIVEIVENKDELNTVRQSAIECLEENEKQSQLLKKITFDQDEPTEVRVAAYRALMTCLKEQTEQQQTIAELIKHCEQEQKQDEQFCVYVISHLDNIRQSEQQEVASIKECLEQNKQLLMQIQILCQKFKQQLEKVREFSRNYKLEQQFNQLETGLVLEGDLVYEKESKKQQRFEILPKLVRVNVSMPVMGETVNVIELTLRQNNMDEQLLSTLKLVQSGKFSGPESMTKVVESFKEAAEKQQWTASNKNSNQNKQQQQQQTGNDEPTEADLSIKVDGQTVVYISLDDIKCDSHKHNNRNQHQQQHQQQQQQNQYQQQQQQNKRQTRSTWGYTSGTESILEAVVEHLKRQPISFNRGFNFALNQRFAKLLDVEASLIAGLRFESRAQRHAADDYEIVVRAEPRLAFESIVGPSPTKMTGNKKLLNRASTKSALGLRLRYKENELVDFELELPMEKMELFTLEQQIVKTTATSAATSADRQATYAYLDDSVYGEQDIYSVDESIFAEERDQRLHQDRTATSGLRMMKRSVFSSESSKRHSSLKSIRDLITGNKRTFGQTYETSEEVARATGLRSKLRIVVSPKEAAYLVQAVAQKVDPRMNSIRVQVQNKQDMRSNQEQKQYQLIVSTPGSRQDRTTQIRVLQQLSSQRSLLKAVVESPMISAQLQAELIHDGRQYAAKVELQSEREKHTAELGFQRGQQSTSGRIAATYKPYLQIQSTQLKRPIQMQAVVSCQWEPKTVIAYELKSMSQSANFVQGKIIIDAARKMTPTTGSAIHRRSMQSPLERMLTQDMTLVAEMVAQLEQHLVKVHHMSQWEPTKMSLQSDFTMQHKNVRKNQEIKTLTGLLKFDEEKQMVQFEAKFPEQPRNDFRFQVVSECKTAQHQLVAEMRYKQNLSQVVAYKHKIQVVSGKPTQWNKLDLVSELEFIATEWNLQEKLAGRTHLIWERQQKSIECELKSNDNKLVKISMDSNKPLKQHKLEWFFKDQERGQHSLVVRSSPAIYSLQSRTDCFRSQKMIEKTEIEILKPTGSGNSRDMVPECRVHVQMPTKQVEFLLDAKLNSGKPSKWAVETPLFVSRGEFTFATVARQARSIMPSLFRFKTEARDLVSKDAYWMESHFERDQPSYVRAHSPIYSAEMELEPEFKEAKFGLFSRQKRSTNQFEDIYNQKQRFFTNDDDETNESKPLDLANKLWAFRSILKRVPTEQKKRIVNALMEFADREQSHKHSFEWNPIEKLARFDLNAKSEQQRWRPMRASGRINTNTRYQNNNNKQHQDQQSSQFELDSEWGQFDIEAKPFDGETGFAKINALSRHPRSAFRKHESEIRYEREHGLRGQWKHEDRDSKLHSISLEADREPAKWAKIQMDSEKHGKAKWEHKWRKEQSKRHAHKHSKRSIVDDSNLDSVYENQFSAEWESPRQQWSQRTQLNFQEPIESQWSNQANNQRNNQRNNQYQKQQKYSVFDYLKNVNGRLQSQYNKQQKPIYELDFDFKPDQMMSRLDKEQDEQQQIAGFNMRLADQWDHKSHFDFIPAEKSIKLSSRSHVDSPTREQIYDFTASTRVPRLFETAAQRGLATDQQEPLFFNDKHQSLDQYNKYNQDSWTSSLFKQPLKLDYSDKFGRAARFDYDHSPISAGNKQLFAGLRQKRAAVYYKDAAQDFEHQSSVDFYPEHMLANKQQHWNRLQQTGNQFQKMFNQEKPGQMTLKTHTKYGPVVAQIDSDDQASELKIVSPIVSAKLTSESASANAGKFRQGGAKLWKLEIDNKQQKMSVEKFIRKMPLVGQCSIAKELAKQFDQARFEHQTELLVSFIESIIKLKSETRNQGSQLFTVEAELNKPQEKLVVKVDGKRCGEAQLAVDLVTKSAQFVAKSNDKHQINHQTRVTKLNEKFYSVESMTSYKQKPVFKMNGKICAELIERPSHVAHQHSHRTSGQEHMSTFDATIFEPTPVEIKGEFDCLAKEAVVQYRNVYSKKTQTNNFKFDKQTETLYVNGKLEEQNNKPVYTFTSKINFPGIFQSRHCHSQSCQSEIIYKSEQNSRDQWAAKLVPGEYVTVLTPTGKQTFNWVF